MYLDEKNEWFPPDRPPRPENGRRREATIFWLVGLNILLLFLAPIGGATVLQAAWRMLVSSGG